VTFIVFFAGCNFRCPFCSNSPLIPTDSGKSVSLSGLKNKILESMGFIDAVGFTGGEPVLQPKPLLDLCRWSKSVGLKTFLNTNGSGPAIVEELSKTRDLDYVALDVKAPLTPSRYAWVSGLKFGEDAVWGVTRTLEVCRRFGIPVEARTTIVPGLIDGEDDIRSIAKVVKGCDGYVIQQFFPFKEVLDPGLRDTPPPRRERLIELARQAVAEGVERVFVRTREHGLERVRLVRA
jgi:pyruvate formate lyase activating enzyme